MSDRCRGCKAILPEKALIKYSDMPKSAQFFPDSSNVDEETGIDIVLKQCPYCGLVQAAGEPVYYYRDVIRATGVSKEMGEYRKKQYGEWVETYNLNNKRVVEIGAGCGEYMEYMESTKALVYGLEHLNVSIEKGRAAGHRMIEGFLEDESYTIEDGPFEGFYTMNFLEHIPNPSAFVRAIANNLTPDAVGIVEVPNFDMMMKKAMYSEFIQDHLSYFTKETLSDLLSRNGFEVMEIKTIWYDYIISAVVRKRSFYSVDEMVNRRSHLKTIVKEYLKDRNPVETAVWGAGHQALANLSLLDMKDKVSVVLDSADFKQDHFTPATHIPVVSPEVLKKGTIKTVIVMAGSYSDEIVDMIINQYPFMDFAIMREDHLEVKDEFKRRFA